MASDWGSGDELVTTDEGSWGAGDTLVKGGRRGTLADAPKPYVPADDGMRPGEAGQGRGMVNPAPAIPPAAPPADMPQGPGAALADIRANEAARAQRMQPEVPVLERPAPPDVQAQMNATPVTDEEMAYRAAKPVPRMAEAKPFTPAQNIAADIREATKNPVLRGAAAGFSQLGQTGVGAVRLAADFLGADTVAGFARGASGDASTVGAGAVSDLRGNDKLVADITSSILNSAPSVALGTIGGPALRTLFAQSTLAEYNAGRDAGFDPSESLARAGIMGTAEALGERFGFPEQIKLLKAVTKGLPSGQVARVFGELLAKEIPGEQLTTAMQFLADKIGPAALQPNATLADYLAAAGDTLKVTIGQTAVMGGGPAAIITGRNAMQGADQAVERSAMTLPERAAQDKGFLRPTEQRKAIDASLDDFAATHGMTPGAAKALKAEGAKRPLDQLADYYRRAVAAFARRGLVGREVDDAALGTIGAPPVSQEPPAAPPVKETAPEVSRGTALPAAELVEPESIETGLADSLASRFGVDDAEVAPAPPASTEDLAGDPINRNWSAFKPESGTLGIPREQLPQIKAEHRGALVNFLGARGITHESGEVPASSLKPTQGEFSPKKVQQASEYQGGDRSILVSSDGYVLDGHHQWLAKLDAGEPVKVIRLDAPIQDLLRLAHQFPSSTTASGPRRAEPNAGAPQPAEVSPPVVGEQAVAPAPSMPTASWVIREKATGKVIAETFDRRKVDALNTAKYEAVPIQEHLASLNRKNAEQPPAQPVAESQAPGRSADGDGGVAPAQAAGGRIIARAGRAPTSTEPLELRPNPDGTLTPHLGRNALVDFESGEPIVLPADVTDADAKKAIRKAKAVSDRVNFFPADRAPKAEAQPPAPPAAPPAPAAPENPPARKPDQRAARAKARMALDPERDSMLQALAKMGGIRRDIMAREFGLKPEELKHTVATGGLRGFPFRKNGGMDLDSALTALREAGYFVGVADEDVRTRFEEAVYNELGGGRELTPQGTIRAAEEARAAEEMDLGALDDFTPDDLEESGYADLKPEVKAATQMLLADAERAGIDTETIKDDAARATQDQPEDAYHARLQAALRQALQALPQDRQGARGSDAGAARGSAEGDGGAAGDQGGEEEGRPDLALTSPTKAQVLAQQDAKEREQADREAPADKPASKLTGEQPDMFNTQASVFAQPAEPPAPAPAAEKPAEPAAASPSVEEGKPATPEKEKAQPAKLEDFGEKLEGARKDQAPSLAKDYSDDQLATEPFSKVWPASEIDAIEDKFAAAVAHAARAEVPAKPRKTYLVQRWVEKVKGVRGLAQRIVSGQVTRERMLQEFKDRYALKDFGAKVRLLEQIDRDQWGRIGEVSEAPEAYRYEGDAIINPKKVMVPMVRVTVDGKNHWLEGSGVVTDHLDAINALLGAEQADKRMQFEVRGGKTDVAINYKGDKERRPLKTFARPEEAFAFIKDHYDELVAEWGSVKNRDNVREQDVRGTPNRQRSAEDYRKGRDVTPEEFSKAFGFRGVQFGNWVEQGKGGKDRQGMLNQAYDALMDLASIVGIPPRALSLNGTLGLSFGARGSGWASAHYEPDTLVINLTKTRGAGTLAHEWFHSLDNYFSHKRGGAIPMERGMSQEAYRQANYITYRPEPLMVHKDGRGAPLTEHRLAELRRANPNSKWFAPDAWQRDPKHPSGVRAEIESRVAALVKALDESPMTERSRAIDKDANGYWSRVIERAARSFENYVIAKMMERGYHNDYLANVTSIEAFPRSKDRYPYLKPEEVAPIAKAFDELFATVQTRETDRGVSLETRTEPIFYSELERQVEKVGMNAAPAVSWKAWLRGLPQKGVKPDEIALTGLEDWLDLQGAKVRKEEVLAYLREKAAQGMALFTGQQAGLEARAFWRGTKYDQGTASSMQAAADATEVLGFKAPVPIRPENRPEDALTPMRYDLDAKVIYYNTAAPHSRVTDVQQMIEEYLHAVDHLGPDGDAHTTISTNSARFMPGGDLRTEIEAASAKSAIVKVWFSYPLDGAYADDRKAAELFARAGVLYHGFPAVMRATTPKLYAVYEQLLGPSASDQRVPGEVRQLDRGGAEVLGQPLRDGGTGKRAAAGDGIGQAGGLQRLRARAGQALGNDGPGRYVGRVLETRTGGPAVTPPDETPARAVQRKLQDQFNRFTVVREWAKEQGVPLTPHSDVWAYEERMHGRISTRVQDFREKVLEPKVKAIQKAGFTMEEVAQFLHAQHAEERNKQIESIDPTNTAGSGMTTAEAQRILASANPRLAALANDFRQITEDTKNILLKAGIISKEMVHAWESTYQHYVPLKGGPDEKAAQTGTGKGLSVGGKQKRALGHSQRSEFIIENILRDHERAIALAEKNTVGHSLLAFIAELGNDAVATVGKPEKRKVLKNSTDYEVRDSMGQRVAIFDSLAGANAFIAKHGAGSLFPTGIKGPLTAIAVKGDPAVSFMAAPMMGDNEVTVYLKGHAIRVQLHDELLARAYTRSGTEALNQLMAFNREINALFSKVYTGYNPEFLLTNMARDWTTGLINVTGQFGAGIATKAAANYPKAFAQMLRYSMTGKSTPDIDAYRASGGSTGAAYLSDIERIGRDVAVAYDEYRGVIETLKAKGGVAAGRAAARKFVGHLLGWLEHLNAAGENAMRLAVFEAVKATPGFNVNDAASAAKNSTVNFNRRGEWGPILGAMYLFFNPAIQGTAAMVDSLVNGKHRAQALALAGSLPLLAYLLAAGQFGGGEDDDEAWEAIPNSDKDKAIVIRTGEKTRVTIPIPYGYAFFYSLGNAMFDLVKGRDPGKVSLRVASNLLEHFSPVGNPLEGDKPDARGLVELVPGAVGGELARHAFRVAANRNSFGGDIVPDSPFDPEKPDVLRLYRSTKGTIYDKTAQALSKATGGTKSMRGAVDWSPETMRYWVRAVTGGAGTALVDSIDWGRRKAMQLDPSLTPDERAELASRPEEMPIIRRFVKEENVKDKRRQFWDAVEQVKAAKADLQRARKLDDPEGEQRVWEKRGELIAMGGYLDSVTKMVKAQRDLVDEIMADESTSLGYKRGRVKALELEEEQMYRELVKEFAEERKRADKERAAAR